MPPHGVFGHVWMLDIDGQSGPAAGARQEGIRVMDV
jgi:hypothetical protein